MPRVSSDIARAMQVALGAIGWPPETFWRATPLELLAAVRGWQEKQGLAAGGVPPGKTEIKQLRSMLQQERE